MVEVKVLLVDDSAPVRTRLASMLREIDGVDAVLETSDGQQALELVRASTPDAVVLDIHMPGVSGLDVLRRIKLDGAAPLVLVLTNDASEQHRRECALHGADYFFVKSTEFDRVIDVVSTRASAASQRSS